MSTRSAPPRGIDRVVTPVMQPGGTSAHSVRLLVEPGRWAEHDPFLLLAEDWFVPGTFPDHPHRGIETVTFVIDGELEHRDNHGGQGVLGAGDAQWMTAGRGIIHREEPRGRVHTLQLWVNLPAADKMTAPGYQDLRAAEMPVREGPGFRFRVFSGASGPVAAATRNHVPVTMVEMLLEPGARAEQPVSGDDRAFVYVLEGRGRFGAAETPVEAGQVAWLDRGQPSAPSVLPVAAEGPLRALFWSGRPLGEPVVARGPFVMNTDEQIRDAYADYRAGTF